MNQFTKKKHFIGIDISKDHLDLAIVEEDGYGLFKNKKVANSFKGYGRIKSWLTKEKLHPTDCLFCMEHTGTYGLLLFAWLSQMGIDYCVEPAIQIKRSLGLTRGKNDKVDGKERKQITGHHENFYRYLALSPDGKMIAYSNGDIWIVDIDQTQVVKELRELNNQ